jgi:hypothetical protein
MFTSMHTFTHTHIHTHARTDTDTDTDTHIHTHTHDIPSILDRVIRCPEPRELPGVPGRASRSKHPGFDLLFGDLFISNMYVCMYACMYVCMYVCVYACMIRMHIYLNTCIHKYSFTYTLPHILHMPECSHAYIHSAYA